MKDITFTRFIPAVHAENTHAIFVPSLVSPRQVHSHVTSDFDVCEVDLDRQMSFLNAAP